MSIETSLFGRLDDGTAVTCYTMKNRAGTVASFLDYGAIWHSFVFDGKDIVLGYDTVEGYTVINKKIYIGVTVGRYCNRIAKGRFSLNGKDCVLACNEANRGGHLHGGIEGFDTKMWTPTVLDDGEEPSIRFTYTSPDGEEGYPGTLTLSVTFTLKEDNTVRISYHATTDKDTVLNVTNHAFFNLNGCGNGNVLNTVLKIAAEEILPVDDALIPTGDFMPVEGTPFDFRAGQPIGNGALGDHPQVRLGGGVDHNFVLSRKRPDSMIKAVEAFSPVSGIRLVCYTDMPGVQVYTGNFLETTAGKYGYRWGKYDGFCLETQFFPDSVHFPEFPSVVLRAGETFESTTTYRPELA